MCTHKVRISDVVGLDDELVGWLREAYERAMDAELAICADWRWSHGGAGTAAPRVVSRLPRTRL